MAGEVAHVVYAARLLTYLGDEVKYPSYWAGTLFPDVRHLGVVSRQHTHPADVSLHTLVGETDFHTGMRVHAWVDATREHFLRTQKMKEYLPWHPFVPHSLKLLEDEILYGRYDDWNLIYRVLNQVYEPELFYVDSKQHVQLWHTILQKYLKNPPNDESRYDLSIAIGLSKNSAEEVNSVVAMLRADKRSRQLLEGFMRHFEHLLL